MIFTGTNRLLLPEINELSFVLSNFVVDTTGTVTISFDDVSGRHFSQLTLSNQKIKETRLSRSFTRSLSTYNLNENFTISGYILNNTGYADFEYFINDIRVNTQDTFAPFYVSGVFVLDVPSGGTVSCDISFYSDAPNYQLDFPDTMTAFTALTGNLTTDKNFWFLGSSTTFSQSLQPIISGDPIIVPLNTGFSTSLIFSDVDDSSQDYPFDFQIDFDSTFGLLTQKSTVIRTGIYDNNTIQFFATDSVTGISGQFDGNWEINQFIYDDNPQLLVRNYFYSKNNVSGNSLGNSISIKFEANSPLNGQTYQSEYVTGFRLTSSGEYLVAPSVVFTGYYYVTGIRQTLSSLLFSSGCTGNIPLTFSGQRGSGASGNLQLLPVTLSNIYQTGLNSYYVVNNLTMISGGTGYVGAPIAKINTGLYSNCYDVANFYGSGLSIFQAFNTSGALLPQASYLTGEVLTTTGLVSGGMLTGLVVTGLNITNIGSGYNATFLPLLSFIRQTGDTLTQNASGILSTKSTGLYDFTGHWIVETGWSNEDFFILNNNSGSFFTQGQYFSVKLTCSGLDNTQPITAKLSVTPLNETGIVEYISNFKYYDTDPLFLKKKVNLEETLFPAGADLSFLTSQDDLDIFYNGDGFTDNGALDIGNLDF